MSTMTNPGADEAQELIDRALKLPQRERERIVLALLHDADPPPGRPDSDREYWKAEIARRIEAVRNGTMRTYSLEETLDHIQKVLDEDEQP